MVVSSLVSRLFAVCIVAGFGCGRDHATSTEPAAPTIELACDDDVRSIEVGELALDDVLCGEPWIAWEIATRGKVELVHAQPARTLRLRRRGSEAVVEVLAGDRVMSTFAGVTRIAFHEPSSPTNVPSITVTKGTSVERLSMSQLAKRYPGSRTKAVPLCQLLEPNDDRKALVVVGQNGASTEPIGRAECERDGLVLHTSNRGGIQLRDRNRRRILSGVTGVVVDTPDTLKR